MLVVADLIVIVVVGNKCRNQSMLNLDIDTVKVSKSILYPFYPLILNSTRIRLTGFRGQIVQDQCLGPVGIHIIEGQQWLLHSRNGLTIVMDHELIRQVLRYDGNEACQVFISETATGMHHRPWHMSFRIAQNVFAQEAVVPNTTITEELAYALSNLDVVHLMRCLRLYAMKDAVVLGRCTVAEIITILISLSMIMKILGGHQDPDEDLSVQD